MYEKTLDLKHQEYSDSTALTLMSNDVDNIEAGIRSFHEVWASPIEVGIALYLLQRQVVWAATIPAVISLAIFFFSNMLSKSAPKRQKVWMQAVRERIAFTSSYLNVIKTVKMLGLSDQLAFILQQYRINELNLQKKFRHVMVKMNLLGKVSRDKSLDNQCVNMTPIAGTTSSLSPVLTLSIYTGVVLHIGRSPLTVNQTFTALSIISLVSTPLSNLVYSGPRVTGALECFERVQTFLLAKSRNDDRIVHHPHSSREESQTKSDSEIVQTFELQPMKPDSGESRLHLSGARAAIIQLHQADFGWDRHLATVLSNISLRCTESSLTIIIGAVGSGKSVLLKAILGEIPCLKGFIHTQVSEVAFCDSSPWIRYGTIRDNICEPLPYEEEWFRDVLHASALDHDVNALPKKDLSIVGSNGMASSGGQRQRISIARAIYARKRVAIFDDVLSSLDAKTSEQVFARVFAKQGILRRHGVTTILATRGEFPHIC